MANPYKKAEQVKKTAPGNKRSEDISPAAPENPVVEQTPVIPVIEEMPQVVPVDETPKAEKRDLFAGMVEEKPRGKSYGFYLDEEVVDALEKLAKQKKISKSKVLNTILRNALLDN